MKRYAPNAMELASRDVVSRSEQTEIDEGRGINGSVMLDLRHLGAERIIERLPGSRELVDDVRRRRPDLRPDPRPAGRPLPHGRRRDRQRRRAPSSTGLYAAGEVACVSVHGANRLGGNSLMETITFGRRAGRAAAEWALSHTTIDVPGARRARRRARAARRCSTATRASGRGRSATSSASRCSRTSASSAARSRWCEQERDHRRAARALRAASSSRTRATSSTAT